MFENEEKILDFITDKSFEDDNTIYEIGGRKVPRVTEILGFFDNNGLIGWANYIGLIKKLRYSEVLNTASNMGTKTHNAIESFLKTGLTPLTELFPFEGFLLWWNAITNSNNVSILGIEEKLICDFFGGTYDLLISINDRPYLVDFKTSNSVKYKHFMQLASYRYMLWKLKGINLEGCIILQLSKLDKGYNEYCLDFKNFNHYRFIEECTTAFFSAVTSYYNINSVGNMFNNIFN